TDTYYCVIDKKGEIAIPAQFTGYRNFKNGLAAVSVGDKWGTIDKKGRYVINPQYYAISDFVSGLAIVRLENKVGVIDKKNNIVIDIKYENNDSQYYYGLSMVYE
ncbi:MAG: WG repeat-containing protein, partial [Oscillospiraceae bacterium]|nr:WG repeat-containing protein [Oscillospiraceae bacterium]